MIVDAFKDTKNTKIPIVVNITRRVWKWEYEKALHANLGFTLHKSFMLTFSL